MFHFWYLSVKEIQFSKVYIYESYEYQIFNNDINPTEKESFYHDVLFNLITKNVYVDLDNNIFYWEKCQIH